MKVNLTTLNSFTKKLNELLELAESLRAGGLEDDEVRLQYAEQMAMSSGLATAISLESAALVSDVVAVLKKEGLAMQTLAMPEAATKEKFTKMLNELDSTKLKVTDKKSN